jgi:putative FmdB family regulatory protein
MPTYEYRCSSGHEFEIVQRMSDEPRATCPECGAEARRLLSTGAGFLFKGEGFYITDYRSDAYRKAAKAETKGSDGKVSEGAGAAGGGSSPDAAPSKSGIESGASPKSGGGSPAPAD